MSSEYLIDHAKENVWQVPDQDFQSIFKLHKLSPRLGLLGKAPVEWQNIALPDSVNKYHVYQIGDVHPSYLGLIPKLGRWISAADQCSNQSMIIDIYNQKGVMVPRFETFIVSLYGRNLIVAIRDQGLVMDLDVEDIFIRFYTNAFFQSVRSHAIPAIPGATVQTLPMGDWHSSVYSPGPGVGGDVLVEGKRLRTRTELISFQHRLTTLRALNVGHIYAFYNGRYVNDFHAAWYTPERFQEGDWAEFVFDTSVKEVVDFQISGLDTFDSTLDSVRKYLLHKYEAKSDTIDYRNDLEVFIFNKIGTYQLGDRWEGIYYGHNHDKALRQVTHQDYSIAVPFVLGYQNALPSMTNPMLFTIRLLIRHGGFKRDLVDEKNRIKDLYRLPPLERKQAFLGINSSLEFWRADVLESANYVKIMDSLKGEIPKSMVEDAYGYNAIARLVADSPQVVVDGGGVKSVTLPVGLRKAATVYEYDVNGILLGWKNSTNNSTYVCRYSNTAFVEGRVGTGGGYLSTVYGANPLTLNPDYDYGFYKCLLVNGLPNGDWQLADPSDYSIVNGVAHWNISGAVYYLCIRNNEHFLNYYIDVLASDGLLIFTVQANEDDPLAPANRVLDLLPNKSDLFLNGHALIENIDYKRIGSQFVVFNKRYLTSAQWQRIVYRGTGLPIIVDGKQVPQLPIDSGFVAYGKLSHNKRYDLKADKVLRIVVDGQVKLRSVLSFPEDGGPVLQGVDNGDPYAVEEVIVPIGEFTDQGTYVMRDESLRRDKAVSDYLTLKLPEPDEPNPNPIFERYEVYSPFIAKIAHDLKKGDLVIAGIKGQYTDAQMETWLKDYLYLLEYDPTRIPVDDRYVIVHPHDLYEVMELNVYHHHLVTRAIKRWMKGKVPTSTFFSIADEFVPITP